MIQCLLGRHSVASDNGLQIYIVYDIACTLLKHLKVRMCSYLYYHEELLVYDNYICHIVLIIYRKMENLKFWTTKLTLPTFHSYGHKHHVRYVNFYNTTKCASCPVYL